MSLTMLKSKLHRLRVTEAHLYYEGSITIDLELLEKADILPYEKVQVLNLNNGARLETYVIPGKKGSRIVCLNGPSARHNSPGDEVIVIAYTHVSKDEARRHKPRIVLVDGNNNPKDVILATSSMNDVAVVE